MLNLNIDTHNDNDFVFNAYTALAMLTAIAATSYAFAKYAESKNRLSYENPYARIIAGFLNIFANTMHTTEGDVCIKDAKLITAGPHRTGWEAVVIASKIKNEPPRFLATDKYNSIPGVANFMNMFKVIIVASDRKEKNKKNKSEAFIAASSALQNQGLVALFPQGGFAKIGEEPRFIYDGAADLALKHNTPISVLRLDGFDSIQNPLIPLSIRNNAYYRAFVSAFHPNNVRVTLAETIDVHIAPKHKLLSKKEKKEKKEEINAQLYAYYRHTQDLTPQQISLIRDEISTKAHLPIWWNKVSQNTVQKENSKLIARSNHIKQSLFENKRQRLEFIEKSNTPEERKSTLVSLHKKKERLMFKSKKTERNLLKKGTELANLKQEEVELLTTSLIR